MPGESDEQDLEEVRALMTRNAEAIERLRRMVEQMEFMLRTLQKVVDERADGKDDSAP